MDGIESELKKYTILLSVFSSSVYNRSIIHLLHDLKDKKICYVTLNKTSRALTKNFKSNKVNTENIFFIDAITHSINKNKKIDNGILVSSPYAFTEMSIAINEVLKSRMFDLIVFDSLSTLKVYSNEKTAIRFTSDIINKIRKQDHKGIFTCLKADMETNLITQSSMYVDRVLNSEMLYPELQSDRIKQISGSIAFVIALLAVLSMLNTKNNITALASLSLPDGTTRIPILFLMLVAIAAIIVYKKATKHGLGNVKEPIEIPSRSRLRAEFRKEIKDWVKS